MHFICKGGIVMIKEDAVIARLKAEIIAFW